VGTFLCPPYHYFENKFTLLAQFELIPELCGIIGRLMPKPEKAIRTQEWLIFKEFVGSIERALVTHLSQGAVPVHLRQMTDLALRAAAG